MFDPDLLSILRCPLTQAELLFADQTMTDRVNRAIELGEARDGIDQRVRTPIEGGLVSPAAKLLYPIRGAIPTLIPEEAIRLDDLP